MIKTKREADKKMYLGNCLFVIGYASLLVCKFDFTEPIKWLSAVCYLMIVVGAILMCIGEVKIIEKIEKLEKALKEREGE